MRILIYSCFILLNTLSGFAQRQIVDKVVATVGGEITLYSEIEEQYTYLKDQQQGNMPENARCFILDNILAQKLLQNQAKLDSIEVGDQDVEAQLNARIDRILELMGSEEQLMQYYGQSVAQLKESTRESLKNQLLAEKMRGQVMAQLTVTPSEVIAFFNRIPKDSLPYFSSEVEVSEIIYMPKVNAEQRQIALEQLQDIRKRIVEGGEDFAVLATQYSDDGSGKASGGDLGWAKRGSYVTEFEAAAYSLEKDQISEIIETQFGFHIIQLLERRGNRINVRHILIKPEITDADLDLAHTTLDSVRQLIASDSMSFSQGVKKYSSEEVNSYNNNGSILNPKTGNSFFEIGDLDTDIYFTIDTMKVGEISQPFSFRTYTGEVNYRLVQLVSRTAPHKASLQLDYSKIQNAALEEKKSLFLNDWVLEKTNNTYINIASDYSSCPNLQRWIEESRP